MNEKLAIEESSLRKALLAVNIRDLFKNSPGENFGLFARGMQVTLPPVKSDFWSMAREFNTKVKKRLANSKLVLGSIATLNQIDPTLIDAIYFMANAKFKNKTANLLMKAILMPAEKPGRSINVTNLGNVNVEKNSKLENIFFMPNLAPNYEKSIGIVTAGDKLNIVVLYDAAIINSDAIEAFKVRSINYIKEALPSPLKSP
ncbi:MAG TPA: hypothetical protein VKM55_06670 [Candidatus Lokiarchaeia archaeon]|nr:hypothetical protein [Candidatus Lokiarchaeia archaeon]